jgi:hypothetical protein|tara:strand:- start:5166 stop:5723 length:558 start_codon:yes stop_codon:yes gene_type:complete
MHTFITKKNVHAAMRDDKAHMTYLKEDVDKDQKYGGKYKDENQTADEKRISKLAGDVKYDEKKEHVSRRSSSPLNQEEIMDSVGQDIDPRSGEWGDKDYELVKNDEPRRGKITRGEDETEYIRGNRPKKGGGKTSGRSVTITETDDGATKTVRTTGGKVKTKKISKERAAKIKKRKEKTHKTELK